MSYVTPFILFVLGVLIWRHQLSAKRRFEVAEQVLAAFHKASDGLSTLRSPMIWAAEIENAKPKKEKEGEDQADDEAPRTKSKEQQRLERRVEMHNVYVARAEAMSAGRGFADRTDSCGNSLRSPCRRCDRCPVPRSPAGVRRRHGTIWWRVLRFLLP